MSTPDSQRTTLRSKVLLGFGMVILMMVIIASISVQSTHGFIHTADWVANAHDAIEIEERMLRSLHEMESNCRAFLATGDDAFLQGESKASRDDIIGDFNALKAVLAQDPRQAAMLEPLRILLQENFARQSAAIEVRRRGGPEAGLRVLQQSEGTAVMKKLKDLIRQAQEEERNILADRADLTERISRSTIAAVTAGSALTIIALAFACLLILRDLTARHRAEEALAQEHNLLSSIINAMPNHVYVKDAKGRFILDNSAHRQHLGLEENVSVEGRTVHDFYTASVAAKFDADDHQVIESGEAILGLEEQSLPLNGEQRETWLESNKVPLYDTNGKIVGLVGVSSDISARKSDEEKLRHFAGKLERSNAELQNFASVASHDLQEPLRKIQAFGDRLLAKCSERLGEQGRDYLARMQNAAERMQTLIQDLLKLSRVTSRAQPFERCDLGVIVRQVVGSSRVDLQACKLEYSIVSPK